MYTVHNIKHMVQLLSLCHKFDFAGLQQFASRTHKHSSSARKIEPTLIDRVIMMTYYHQDERNRKVTYVTIYHVRYFMAKTL